MAVDSRALAALRSASAACHASPHLPEPHYRYGQAWLAMDEPARAEQAFAAAIALRPAWPDAWINYGLARYRQGALEDAKAAMRRVLGDAPGHSVAIANLGALLRITGEVDAAETLLRQTLVREPGNVGARLNWVADLLNEGRSAEALALLDDAKPPVPDATGTSAACRHWLLQRALALLQLGRAAEARAALATLAAAGPVPPEIAPLWHWRHVLLALAEGDPGAAREAAGRMEDSLAVMGAEAVLEHQIMARYDLAKFWSGEGAHPVAFTHWTEGHRLLREIQPFSRAAHLAFVDANIAAFDRVQFAHDATATARSDPAPVFIVGMPRSGTTLCERILAAHRDVHGAGERSALAETFERLADTDRSTPEAARRVAALDGDELDRAAASYLAALRALAPDKRRVVDKMPSNYLGLGLAGRLLPGARIIHCVRDPRDIGLSIFTFRFHGAHGYAHDLGDLGWTIAQQERLMAHWKAEWSTPILTIRLADWVTDFDATLGRVLAHLDLPPDPNCARFHETESRVRTVSRDQVREPINARSLGRWHTYAAELAPLIAELEQAGALAGWTG